jgi:hypothetical protein
MSSFRESSTSNRERLVSIERVVMLFTPLFSAASGFLATEVATLVNVKLPSDAFTGIFIAGAATAAAAAIKWLHGRNQWLHDVRAAEESIGTILPVQQVETMLKSHEEAIIAALGKSVHAPPGVEELAKEIVRQLWPTHAAGAAQEAAVVQA